MSQGIWWNFEKFVVDSSGKVVSRYGSTTTPAGLESEVAALLKERAGSARVAVKAGKGKADRVGSAGSEAMDEKKREADAPLVASAAAGGGGES